MNAKLSGETSGLLIPEFLGDLGMWEKWGKIGTWAKWSWSFNGSGNFKWQLGRIPQKQGLLKKSPPLIQNLI